MLRIKYLFVSVLIISYSIMAQNLWTTQIQIDFIIQSNTKVTSFVDANGMHIAYSRNGGIRYALVNSQGGVIKYDKLIEAEGSDTKFTNVVAIGNDVYVFYYKNNFIQVAKSSNLGDNWNNSFSNRQMSNYGCDTLVGYLDANNNIHIVWTETRVSGYQPESHYIKFVPNDNTNKWQNYYKVTDVETEGGNKPDVAISTDKVHVDYVQPYPNSPKSRTRLTNGTWETPQLVPFYLFPYTTPLQKVKPIITGGLLNEIYRANYGTIGVSGSYIGHSYRPLNSSTWTQNPDIINTVANKSHLVEKTSDNKIHIISFDEQQNNYVHRTITGTTISSIISNVPFYELSKKLTANSNDLYLIQAGNTNIPSKIFYRHYDAAPLAPQNLTAEATVDYHPKLIWNNNTDADIQKYFVYRSSYRGGYTQIATVTHNNLTSTQSYIDNTITVPLPGGHAGAKYYYVVSAVDVGQHVSDYSNYIEVTSAYLYWEKQLAENNTINLDFNLNQNYPNPFNPSTKISFSIKEEGFVTLRVYDVLGKVVTTLVNENKPEGIYEAEFNASSLPSGMYIYKLQAGSFTDVKKMLLTK